MTRPSFSPLLVEVVDGLLDGLAAGAHGDDHALGIGGAHVVEELVLAAGQLADLLHDLFHDGGGGVVELVGRLTVLEVDVGVLRGAGLMRMLGVEGAVAEGLDLVPGHQGLACPRNRCASIFCTSWQVRKPSKKCRKGTLLFSVDRCATSAMSMASCTLLEASMAKPVWRQAITSAWSPKMRQRVRGQRAGAYVEHAGQQFAGDLVHIGDHQQKALARQ